jgi:hypothetical protein
MVTDGATLASQSSVAVAAGKFGVAGHSIGVVTVGQLMTGGVLSVTKMVLLQVLEFPQSSTAVQVRVTEYSCGQMPLGVVTSLEVGVTLASQSSVAVAAGKFGVAGHSIGVLTVGQLTTGASVSSIVMISEQEEVHPGAPKVSVTV